MRNFVRQKTIHCGDSYREVDIYNYTFTQQDYVKKKKRSKKEKVSPEKQRNLNDKNARRYLVQLGNLNFSEEDIHASFTYNKKYLPETIEEAEKEVSNLLRRIQYKRKKEGLPALKYILVTAYSEGKEVRIHHHIIMNGGLDRDVIEDLWRKRRKKGQKKGDRIGYINADRLQPDENGIAALSTYLAKHPSRKKRWSTSQNLKKPESKNNDSRYSRRQIEKLAKERPGREYWEKQYPGWTLTDEVYGEQYEHNEITGWAIYLKLRRIRR